MNTRGQGILWLASYPKSGNTWFRAFYTNLIEDRETPALLDELAASWMASSRQLCEIYTGLEVSNFTQDEIERLRPLVYENLAREESKPISLKIHDAYTLTSDGRPLIPRQVTQAAIYLVRNPLDVAVSFAHHNACAIDTMIGNMADESFCLSFQRDRIGDQVRQRLLSWSQHVTSWLDGLGDLLHLVRYEDLVLRPMETFSGAVHFAQLPDNPARIQKAIRFSEFSELQKQEITRGFKGKPQKATSFFRQGKVGSWRESLTDRQVQRIIDNHRAVMKRLGYLNEQDQPLF